ncbi:hypothetical protein PC128_g2856 [Phytophthora cactorum]|nr:hypothetical protein PC128_g2856 [Phytophthora cactorum]KAG4063179.1 hypothetical protein PC123_g2016 [Phytophthora cactorum]
MTVLDQEANAVQQGTLVEFHKRLGHLNFDAVERLARDLSSGIKLTWKQTKSCQSNKDSGEHSPIDRVVGLACSYLKGSVTPKARLNNRYTFDLFLLLFEGKFRCEIHVLRTESGGEYENVYLFRKRTGVARQRGEAPNQASNGKTKRMHRTITSMARCMIFACGLPLSYCRESVQDATAPRVKVLAKQTLSLGKVVASTPPCKVYRDPRNRNFSQHARQGIIVGIGEETKGYRVYLPNDKVVVTAQHVQNKETLDKTQNEQVQRLYLSDDNGAADEDPAGEATKPA